LVDAGVAILTEEGLEKLSLRKCAARAGVSHAAPAHHFDGVEGLRGAIADEGFRVFRNYLLIFRALAGDDPYARVKGICRGYLYFARNNPALFELIFGIRSMQHTRQALPESPGAAYDVLRETCAPFVAPGADPRIVEMQVWSLIQGYCVLFLAEQLGEGESDPFLTEFDQFISLLDHLPLPDRG
jgi:AcrR family transcriptional regulator